MLFCTSLLMFNCQNEENSSDQLQNEIETVPIDEARSFLMHSKNSSSSKSVNRELENLEFDKITQEKIMGSDQLLTVIPFATNNDVENNRILLLKIDNDIESVVFSMYADEHSVKGSFSGELFVYSLAGDFINGFRAKDGIIVSRFVETNIENGKTSKSTGRAIQLKEVVVRGKTVHALDMFGSTGGMYGDGLFGGGIGNSGGGGYSWDAGGGISAPTSEEIATALEKQINGSQLDPCTKAVLEKLKNLKQGDIANMIARFAPAGSIFNINMSIGQVQNNDPSTWAQTTSVSGSNTDINMIFNQDYINGKDNPTRPTDLSVAATMAHEVIHAYLISLLNENKTLGASVIYDFPTVYEAYVQQQIIKNPNILPDAHHELIAEKYIDAIAATIQEFHTGQPVNSNFPYQVYRDMAWGGLQDTYIFNKNFPNDPTHINYKERERIFARINTEKKGEKYGINLPIGTPCKK